MNTINLHLRNSLNMLLASIMMLIGLYVTGCGGGSESSGAQASTTPETTETSFSPEPTNVSIDQLTGRWYGTEEDVSDNSLGTIALTVSSSRITYVTVDGEEQGLTGTVSKVEDQLQQFTFVLSDGTRGGFYVDNTASHAIFLDDELSFGVIEKHAASIPPLEDVNAIDGKWSGSEVSLDSNFDVSKVVSAQVDCTVPDCTISNGENTSMVSIQKWSANNHYYSGTFADSDGTSGDLHILTTADNSFAGSLSCSSTDFVFPTSCRFGVWQRADSNPDGSNSSSDSENPQYAGNWASPRTIGGGDVRNAKWLYLDITIRNDGSFSGTYGPYSNCWDTIGPGVVATMCSATILPSSTVSGKLDFTNRRGDITLTSNIPAFAGTSTFSLSQLSTTKLVFDFADNFVFVHGEINKR